jgi:hypothetical protein
MSNFHHLMASCHLLQALFNCTSAHNNYFEELNKESKAAESSNDRSAERIPEGGIVATSSAN